MAQYPNDQGNPAGAIPVYLASGSGSPASTMTNAQVSVGATATKLFDANPAAKSRQIVNSSTVAVYIGGDDTVTTSTGAYLPDVAGATMTLNYTGDVYGIVATGSENVATIEFS